MPDTSSSPAPAPRRRPLWRRIATAVLTLAATLAAVTILALALAAWILTPGRLTPLVERYANEAIDGSVTLRRAELTIWSTFPRIEIRLDSLTVTSGALASLPDSIHRNLPADADTLLRMRRLGGALHLAPLLTGSVSLYDVEVQDMRVNAVAISPRHANYMIFPTAEPEPQDTAETPLTLPDISVSRLTVVDSLSVCYLSVADSINARLTLRPSDLLSHSAADTYRISVSGLGGGLLTPALDLDPISLGLDGSVRWSPRQPESVGISDMTVAVADISARISADVTFGTDPTIETFAATVEALRPSDLTPFLPTDIQAMLRRIDTDMAVNLSATLKKPYRLATAPSWPTAEISLDVPDCSAVIDGNYSIQSFTLAALADIDGERPDATTVKISRLGVQADGMRLSADLSVANPLSDPMIDGGVKACATLGRLPRWMLARIPAETIEGTVDFDSHVRLRQSYLRRGRFYRIKAEGTLALNDIDIESDSLRLALHTRSTRMRLGTSDSFTSDTRRIDSLLTASISIDTISACYSGMSLAGRDLRAGIGCQNKPYGADTTAVFPFGASIRAAMLAYRDVDSSAVRLADAAVRVRMQRYEGNAHRPMLTAAVDAGKALYADRTSFLALAGSHADLTLHPKEQSAFELRLKEKYDSIAKAHPDAPADSLRAMMASMMPRRLRADTTELERMDFGLDQGTRRLLRRWDASGDIRAGRGAMFSTQFPLRNRIDSLDIGFSVDSIILRNLQYRIGRSDIRARGAIRNLRRALTWGAPLRLSLRVNSDTLNIDQLIQTAYAGAARTTASGPISLTPEGESQIDSLASSADTTARGPLLVPVNIEADIAVRADNIIYSGMTMHSFSGRLRMADGAISMKGLHASSDIGSASLNALYSAPSKDAMRFGFGLQLADIDVKEFVDLMPAVDSLMPLLSSFKGIIDADIAATASIDTTMDINLPSLEAAIKLSGNDLQLLDAETFRTISKWLMFKDKKHNRIDSMTVELLVADSRLELFPFVFDFDRYRLAVMGSNDLDLNYKYHISVLKSPLPFKFGINLSGNPDKMKVRLGGAKYKPGQASEKVAIVDTTRINLIREMDRIFTRGARRARLGGLNIAKSAADTTETPLTAADSTALVSEGLLPPPAPSDTLVR